MSRNLLVDSLRESASPIQASCIGFNLVEAQMGRQIFLKLVKLTFNYFKQNADLFNYYATTDTLTFSGVATPELAEALYDHLQAGEFFECKVIEREDHSFKLVELLDHPKITFSSPESSSEHKESYGCGALPPGMQCVLFTPRKISLYNTGGNIVGSIKSLKGEKYFGQMEKSWVLWYLTMMRRQKETLITILKYSKRFVVYINRKNVTRAVFVERKTSTYLDNREKFFFANDSHALSQSDLF